MKKMYIDIIDKFSFNVLLSGYIFLVRHNGYLNKWCVYEYSDFLQEEITLSDKCVSRKDCIDCLVFFYG